MEKSFITKNKERSIDGNFIGIRHLFHQCSAIIRVHVHIQVYIIDPNSWFCYNLWLSYCNYQYPTYSSPKNHDLCDRPLP